MKDELTRWFEYDEWATHLLLKAVSSLSKEQFAQELAGPLSSVRQQCVHLLSVHDRYLARVTDQPVPNVSPESFTDPGELLAYHETIQKRLHAYLASLTPADLPVTIEHHTRRGLFLATLEETLRHMLNHATYHRGQIACLLKLHGIEPVDTDYIIWINP